MLEDKRTPLSAVLGVDAWRLLCDFPDVDVLPECWPFPLVVVAEVVGTENIPIAKSPIVAGVCCIFSTGLPLVLEMISDRSLSGSCTKALIIA